MQHYKNYVRNFFIILGVMILSAASYAHYFSKHFPLPLTNRISFDAKLKFIKEHVDVDKVDTIIVGSSIGLNNIQGVYLEKASKKANHVLNLSVYEASVFQVEQLLELSDAFPNLKRIIYSVQFSDFPYPARFTDYDPEFLRRYIRDELSPLEKFMTLFKATRDLQFLYNRQQEWPTKHGMNNKFTYLGFDASGSVPLHIYGKDIIRSRYSIAHSAKPHPRAYEAVARMTKRATDKGIKYYFVQQPYRQKLVRTNKYVNGLMQDFITRNKKIMQENGGIFLSLHNLLKLEDKYFADRSHLNDKGSIITSKTVGQFIDHMEQ